jgi:type VI secretion system secreted protein Hcp
MTDCLVTSVSNGGSGGEDRLTENATLNFAKVKVEYMEQAKDGTGTAGPEFAWNIEANEPA